MIRTYIGLKKKDGKRFTMQILITIRLMKWILRQVLLEIKKDFSNDKGVNSIEKFK